MISKLVIAIGAALVLPSVLPAPVAAQGAGANSGQARRPVSNSTAAEAFNSAIALNAPAAGAPITFTDSSVGAGIQHTLEAGAVPKDPNRSSGGDFASTPGAAGAAPRNEEALASPLAATKSRRRR